MTALGRRGAGHSVVSGGVGARGLVALTVPAGSVLIVLCLRVPTTKTAVHPPTLWTSIPVATGFDVFPPAWSGDVLRKAPGGGALPVYYVTQDLTQELGQCETLLLSLDPMGPVYGRSLSEEVAVSFSTKWDHAPDEAWYLPTGASEDRDAVTWREFVRVSADYLARVADTNKWCR